MTVLLTKMRFVKTNPAAKEGEGHEKKGATF